MKLAEDIKTEHLGSCIICQSTGIPLYQQLYDQLFNAPGYWNLLRCPNHKIAWLSPRPTTDDIVKVYSDYYTHGVRKNRKSVLVSLKNIVEQLILKRDFGYNTISDDKLFFKSITAKMIPMATEIAGSSVMWLSSKNNGKLLDVGCGNGSFLSFMKALGWEVTGIEPDLTAAAIAKENLGDCIITGSLNNVCLPDNTFDAITASHVIEHMHEPIRFLEESFRLLKPGGKLVIMTPNLSGLGHRLFKRFWRGLEIPRHLFLFSSESLEQCVKNSGFDIELLRTTARSAWEIWYTSYLLRKNGNISEFTKHLAFSLRCKGLLFQLIEHFMIKFKKDIGEAIILIALKPNDPRTD